MTVLQIFSIVANIGVIIVDSIIIVLLVRELKKWVWERTLEEWEKKEIWH